MAIATLTSKGRITLPLSVRKALGLRPGAKVDFVAQSDGFMVVARDTHVSRAVLPGAWPSLSASKLWIRPSPTRLLPATESRSAEAHC